MKVERTLQLLLAERILVLVKIKESIRNWGSSGLIVRVMVRLQVGVLEGFFDCDTLGRVECEKSLQEVKSLVVALREEGLEGNLLLEGEGADVLARTAGLDSVVVFHGWCTQDVKDKGQLVVIFPKLAHDGFLFRHSLSLTIFSGEQGLSAQHLGQYTSNTPHINSFCVFLEGQHDFWRTVPTCRNVFRHESGIIVGRRGRTGQTKVADFQVAVCVE